MKEKKSKKNKNLKFDASNLTIFNEDNAEALSKHIKSLSKDQKEHLVANGIKIKRYDQPKTKKVNVGEILWSPSFLRFDSNDDFDDLASAINLDPIRVAIVAETSKIVGIEGTRRLKFAKLQKHKKIVVEIVGEVESESQISLARAISVITTPKPMTNLEISIGLVNLRRTIIREFGKDAFHSNGGYRGSEGNKKQSLNQFIADNIGLSLFPVQALVTFGRRLGTYAVEGLFSYEEYKRLSLRRIQKLNPELEKAKIRSQINKRKRKLEKNNVSREERVNELGKIAFEFFTNLDTSPIAKTSKKSGEELTETSPHNIDPADFESELEKKKKPTPEGSIDDETEGDHFDDDKDENNSNDDADDDDDGDNGNPTGTETDINEEISEIKADSGKMMTLFIKRVKRIRKELSVATPTESLNVLIELQDVMGETEIEIQMMINRVESHISSTKADQ